MSFNIIIKPCHVKKAINKLHIKSFIVNRSFSYTMGLSRILNIVVMCHQIIPLLLGLNAHYIIKPFVKADHVLTHAITSPIPLMQFLHAYLHV